MRFRLGQLLCAVAVASLCGCQSAPAARPFPGAGPCQLQSFAVTGQTTADLEGKVGQEVRVVGTAQNGKAGALVLTDSGEPVYIRGLEEWAPGLVGKKVVVEGRLERERIFPEVMVSADGAISQGMDGIPLSLRMTACHAAH